MSFADSAEMCREAGAIPCVADDDANLDKSSIFGVSGAMCPSRCETTVTALTRVEDIDPDPEAWRPRPGSLSGMMGDDGNV